MDKKSLFIEFACHRCNKSEFAKRQYLYRHYQLVEKISLPSPPKGRPYYAISASYVIISDKSKAQVIKYSCPCCNELLDGITDIGKHIESSHLKSNTHTRPEKSCSDVKNTQEEEHTNNEPASLSEDLDFVAEASISDSNHLYTINPALKLQLPDRIAPTVQEVSKKQRTEQEAIIYACQKQESDIRDQNQAIFLVDNLSLRPFSILDNKGNEENALAHEDIVRRLAAKQYSSCKPIVPMKRPYEQSTPHGSDSLCVGCGPSVHSELQELFDVSPYAPLLKQREFAPLTNEMCGLMNRDWRMHPQVKYYTAKIMSGAILLNTRSRTAVMLNTIEVYGRTKIVDAHREPFGKLKDGIQVSSLPPPYKTLYPDVWPVLISRGEGPKLVIGTQVSNALVTASTRLDRNLPSSVGAVTTHFNMSASDSYATKIFVDMESATLAKNIISNSAAMQVSNTGMLSHQLRQLRTRFDLPSTYTLSRSSGPLTKSHTCHPYTVFTLADCDRGGNSSALIFDTIAYEVLKNGTTGKLAKSVILNCMNNATGKVREIVERILALYGHEDNLTILFNADLNMELENLARLLMPSIVSWNDSVARQIKEVFESATDLK